MAVRVLLYVPLAMFQIDSDAVLAGLCAFKVSSGHFTAFFPGGSRLSSASCYLAAAYFRVFGVGRMGLALTALTWSALYLIFSLAFFRATLLPATACIAFVFAAFPSEQFMTVTYAPWAYGEIVASCAAMLWLAARWRNGASAWVRCAFGIAAGVGLWFSLETLMVSLPAIAWIAMGRRRSTLPESLPALAGAIGGATPLLLGNVTAGFPTFMQNWASKSVSDPVQFLDNLKTLLAHVLPNLLVRSSGLLSESGVLALAYAVVTCAFVGAALRRPAYRDAALIVMLVLVACILIFSASAAGSIPGWTIRYVVPFYVIVPIVCGIGIATIWSRSRALAALCILALVLPNLYLYGLPGSPERTQLTNQWRDDVRFRQLLARDRVRMVYGDYFWVYHLAFDTREGTLGIPFAPVVDYFDYARVLDSAPVRYAFLGNPSQIAAWSGATGTHGSITRDGDLIVWIADAPAQSAAQLIAALRRAGP